MKAPHLSRKDGGDHVLYSFVAGDMKTAVHKGRMGSEGTVRLAGLQGF